MRPIADALGRLVEYDAAVGSFASASDDTVRAWVETEGRRADR
jgi:hypothetical protein